MTESSRESSNSACRPTFLVVEVEPREGISVRKLVLETAKYNVLTAHSGKEGLAMLKRFPAVDAVVVHAGLRDMHVNEIAKGMKREKSKVPVIVLAPNISISCPNADRVLSSHEPQSLLAELQELVA